ncbi:unnamed protein product [Lasius platythorax]|uniref:Uncharacterized protein n=1 Tax=Lasius platythorax TaxID=488582 RepID=A0AAV2NBG2_9HYME
MLNSIYRPVETFNNHDIRHYTEYTEIRPHSDCSSKEWFFLQRTFGSGLRRRSKGFRAIHLNGTGGGKEQDEQQGKVLIVMKHESDLVG